MRNRNLILPPTLYEIVLELIMTKDEAKDIDFATKLFREIKQKKIEIAPRRMDQLTSLYDVVKKEWDATRAMHRAQAMLRYAREAADAVAAQAQEGGEHVTNTNQDETDSKLQKTKND